MPPIGKETTNFIDACEAIHALLERGDTLTPEDRDLIEFNADARRGGDHRPAIKSDGRSQDAAT